MNSVSYSKKWSILTFSLCSFIMFFYIKDGLFSINSWLYNLNGDSLKNYYNVLISAKYSTGLWLNKVNYPFGEQLFYLDSQPLLAKTLGFLGFENYTIGFVNALPFISIAITSIPIFLIQRTLRIPLVINITTSIIIALLSSQIGRVSVHFALAYTIYIPLLLYLITRKELNGINNYFFLTCTILLFSFLHPYYLLIGIVLLATLLPYHLFFQFNLKILFCNLLAILIPLIIVKLTLNFTDIVTDRPENPFGIWKYRSSFESVFFPKFKPFIELISGPLGLNPGTFEGNAYVGILGLPIFIFSIVYFIKKRLQSEKITSYFRTEIFFYLFFSSVIIWLFSLYHPFKFIIDPTLEIAPVLKQFRSLGRFGWIFYYTFSIFISINISNFYAYLKNKTSISIAVLAISILLSLWFLDANGNMNTIKHYLSKKHYVEVQKSSYLSNIELSEIDNNSYDAILTLPVFHVGSEIENYEGSSLSIFETFKIASDLGIPFVSTYSSRVSASQFQKIQNLKMKGDFSHLFKKGGKILLIADIRNLNLFESELLLKNTTILFRKGDIVYAELTP